MEENIPTFLGRQRANAVVDHLRPYIEPQQSVLDIGAGSCAVSYVLTHALDVSVEPLDVVDHNLTNLNLTLYDGETLPYQNNTFDVSLLIFVLHHAADYARLLKEARRVTRSNLLVMEDTPHNAIETRIWRKADYKVNHARHEDISVAHDAKRHEEWTSLFAKNDLSVVSSRRFRSVF